MPPSTILQLLIQLQTDLNNLTINCVDVNSSVTDLIGLYNGEVQRRSSIIAKTGRFADALDAMSDSLEKFKSDALKLEEYLNAHG